jgi:hypothetical protein
MRKSDSTSGSSPSTSISTAPPRGGPITRCRQRAHERQRRATAERIGLDESAPPANGADEVERGTLNLIKGLGGALLREKIVAAASHRLAIVVDGSMGDNNGEED